MMNSKELLQQQLSATPRKRKPKGVKPDLAAGIKYNVELQRIVKALSNDINRTILPLVKTIAPEYQRDNAPIIVALDSWVDILAGALKSLRERWTNSQFQLLANDISRTFIRTANESNLRKTERDLGINLYGDSQQLTDYIQASIVDNTRLITSIPEQYLTQVESIVFNNVRAGGRPSAIAKQLQQQLGVTERRAKMIARDQTSKVNSNLASMRIKDAGFEYFKWETSNDERVRDRHEDVSKRVTAYGEGVYRFDNPPWLTRTLNSYQVNRYSVDV